MQLESVLEFKEMNNIHYCTETSAKSGKNIEQMFTDCAKLLYQKYKTKFHEVGGDGDLSSDNESFDDSQERTGSFAESGGHRVTRNGKLKKNRRHLKKHKQINKKKQC